MSTTLETIVFDIGRVIVDFSFDSFTHFLGEHGAQLESTDEFIEKTDLHKHEHGEISADEFISNIQNLLKTPADSAEIVSRWQRVFTPKTEMLELLGQLKPNHQVLLMSNTSELHWSYLCSEYQLDQLTHGAITSFEAGSMKPDPKIYQYAEDQFSLTPSTTVFIDDIKLHTDYAQTRGWFGIHHNDHLSTKAELSKIGAQISTD